MNADEFDIEIIRARVRRGDYLTKSHAVMHLLKEGFTPEHIVEAVLNGKIIEEYPSELRVLICGQATLTDRVWVYLHVVCEYINPSYAEFITAYIPDESLWQNPPYQRRQTRK